MTQATTPNAAPCPCLQLCGALPYPTSGSVTLTVDRGRVLRIEDLGPMAESEAQP